MWIYQELLLANISSNLLKKSFRKTSLFVLTVIVVMEKVFFWLHISNYYFNTCDQNPLKIPVKKFIFRNFRIKYLETLLSVFM